MVYFNWNWPEMERSMVFPCKTWPFPPLYMFYGLIKCRYQADEPYKPGIKFEWIWVDNVALGGCLDIGQVMCDIKPRGPWSEFSKSCWWRNVWWIVEVQGVFLGSSVRPFCAPGIKNAVRGGNKDVTLPSCCGGHRFARWKRLALLGRVPSRRSPGAHWIMFFFFFSADVRQYGQLGLAC